MAQNAAQRRASDAVAAWLAFHEWNNTQLVTATGADAGTIGDFLNGMRWPKTGTQGKIEKALGWAPGTIRAIAAGAEPPDPAGSPGAERDPLRQEILEHPRLSDRDKRLLLAQYDAMLNDRATSPEDEKSSAGRYSA